MDKVTGAKLVSVVIPTYNRAELLKDAVHSVHQQTYRPMECIVVDDGSKDHTSEAMDSLKALQGPGFTLSYVRQANAGAQVARNTGTAAASGDYIQYLDSDDLLYPGKIAAQVEYLEQHPGCDGVFGDWDKGLPGASEKIIAHAEQDLYAQFLAGRCIATFSFLMRRGIIDKSGGWDPAIRRNQEIDFHVRALLAGASFAYQSLPTGLWRIHPNERIANTTGLKDVIFFYRKMERLLAERGLFSEAIRKKIAALYMWLVSENINRPNEDLVPVLEEAVRLDKDIGFFDNRKLRLMALLTGKRTAFGLWLNRFRKTFNAR
jgi:glycosyltransferase involved in cell wall biosynthesis